MGRNTKPAGPSQQNEPGSQPVPQVTDLHKLILASLDQDKAEDIVSLELSGKSSLADYMIIASGRSSRQVAAMAEHIQERVRNAGFGKPRMEGLPQADWVLIDAGDVIVHLFRPEVRSFYELEKMWSVELVRDSAG